MLAGVYAQGRGNDSKARQKGVGEEKRWDRQQQEEDEGEEKRRDGDERGFAMAVGALQEG
jgi:hypothetical protein